ncbi:hypothetical protein HW532_12535 [Kaustia mangrovi]|uniref:SH3b domain-containing protein n=2 Tax=Kaustia mangrovi TaxID=2593653 RepID=A0A7S8C4W5_9HYPH|nr:hypothetical protein HW532_12535 [Kaustia mangrovi]
MRFRGIGRTRMRTVALAMVAMAIVAAVATALLSSRNTATAGSDDLQTAAVTPLPTGNTGPSGLPLPRFVSLKTDRVNVRRGPSTAHQVSWVFARKGLPVEIIAEYDHWRRVRDSEGEEGWVYHSLLTGRRTALVAPWRRDGALELHSEPNDRSATVARLETGVVGDVVDCTGEWCEITVSGYDGWIEQTMLWGVYPGERID